MTSRTRDRRALAWAKVALIPLALAVAGGIFAKCTTDSQVESSRQIAETQARSAERLAELQLQTENAATKNQAVLAERQARTTLAAGLLDTFHEQLTSADPDERARAFQALGSIALVDRSLAPFVMSFGARTTTDASEPEVVREAARDAIQDTCRAPCAAYSECMRTTWCLTHACDTPAQRDLALRCGEQRQGCSCPWKS